MYTEQKTRKNIEYYYEDIEMPGGYRFNHVETLKMIDLYYNSKYKTGQYDNLGLRKFFFNIVKPACDIATKFIDLDTKDIVLIPEHASTDSNEFIVWVMQRKLKQYLKDTNFGSLSNKMSHNLPKYGSFVIKKDYECEWHIVNLQNLRFNPTSKKLCYSEFVYELSSMTRSEINEMGWNKEMVNELYKRGDEQTYHVYDCYDKTEEGWHRTVRGDLFSKRNTGGINRSVESEINNQGDFYGGLILHEEDIKEEELPYREDHFERVPGRWLGYGFVEYLEENQIAINEAENLERKGLVYTSLKLFQTRDENVAGSNILSAAQNGDIMHVESEITQIDMSERNLNAYNNTRSNWSTNTERKTFTTDITTGANLPSRTPLGVANLQASFAASYFDLKRENHGLFIKELILDDIIPDFEKDTNKEHILTFLGSDEEIDKLDELIAKRYIDDAVLDYATKHGYFPSQIERERVKKEVMSQIKKNKNRYLTVGAGKYRNAEYFVDVNITGESIDNGTKSQVIQMAMQIMNTNPNVFTNPVSRKMFTALLSLGGISPLELGITDAAINEQQQQMQQQQQTQQGQAPQLGGSISVPQANPGLTQTTKTL